MRLQIALNSDLGRASTMGIRAYHVAREAVGRGHDVVVLARAVARGRDLAGLSIRRQRGSLLVGKAASLLRKRVTPGIDYGNLMELAYESEASLASRRLAPPDVAHLFGSFARLGGRMKRRGAAVVVEAFSHPAYQLDLARQGVTIDDTPERVVRAEGARFDAVLRVADVVISPSPFVTWTLGAFGPTIGARVVEIPYGVDLPSLDARSPGEGRPVRFLFAGHLKPTKGILDLLAAWARADLSDAELWLCGRAYRDGSVQAALAKARGVRVLGHVEDMRAIYPQCDVYVFPSLFEGSSKTTYEALSWGIPVITTPNAGSVVRDGVEGHIVPPGDPAAVESALRRLHADGGLRARMGSAARRRAEEFTWDVYAKRVVDALEKARVAG